MNNYKKERIYIYPITSRGKTDSQNPYLFKLAASLDKEYHMVNIDHPSGSGILQMFEYFFRTDIAMFNWIENLPERKGGRAQILLLSLLLYLYRIWGKTIIWTMHNKISHSKEGYKQKKKVFQMMLRHSHLILTHSSEGIRYGMQLNKRQAEKIHYIPHPMEILKDQKIISSEYKYDFLIWGSMVPYKGVHNFLRFLKDQGYEDKYSIQIIGKFSTPAYFEEVSSLAGKNTTVENRFASMEELTKLVHESRYVLFTYSDDSVLSSGALMDTLTMGAGIIGPDTGAFADLAEEGIIQVYKDFSEIPALIEKSPDPGITEPLRTAFINDNTWQEAGKKIHKLLLTRNV